MNGSLRGCGIGAMILIPSLLPDQGLQAPTALTVTTATRSSVQLSWTAPPSGAPGYIVERKTLTGSFAALPNTPDAGTPGVTLPDNTITPITPYVNRVRAVPLTSSSATSTYVSTHPP